jgi:glycosyltransferase involved in cell wall biosynthesis
MAFEYDIAVTKVVAPFRVVRRLSQWARRLVRAVVPNDGPLADALRRARQRMVSALPAPGAPDASSLLEIPAFEAPTRAKPRVALAIGSLSSGGAERQLVAFATSSRARAAIEPMIVVLYGPEGAHGHYAPAAREAGVPIVVAGESVDPAVLGQIQEDRVLAQRLSDLPDAIRPWVVQMAGEFLRLKPDCVHAWLDHQNIWSGVAALVVGVPHVVLSTRNVNPTHFPYLDQPWFRDWYRLLLRSPRVTVINNSRPGAADYAEWLGCAPERIRVVLNGLDPRWISRPDESRVAALRAELVGSVAARVAQPLVVGGVFRLSEEKQPRLWLDVAHRLARDRDDVVFFHAGEGPLEGMLRAEGGALIKEGRLHLLGRRSDVPALLSAADILLHTARFEGTPNVLLEAAHLGCPTVATTAGGSVDAVDHGGTGFLCDPGDGDALHRAAMSLLSDAAMRARMRTAGPSWITSRFGLDRMVMETLDCYPMLAPRAS